MTAFTQQFQAMQATITALQVENASLKSGQVTAPSPTVYRLAHFMDLSARSDGRPGTMEKKKFYRNNNACWTCGYDIAKNHNSQNCNRKKPGHNVLHTGDNPMPGHNPKDIEFLKWKDSAVNKTMAVQPWRCWQEPELNCDLQSNVIENLRKLLFPYTNHSVSVRKKNICFQPFLYVARCDRVSHHSVSSGTALLQGTKHTASKMVATDYWKLPNRTTQQIASAATTTPVSTSNSFAALTNDDIDDYIMYKWKYLYDTGTTGN